MLKRFLLSPLCLMVCMTLFACANSSNDFSSNPPAGIRDPQPGTKNQGDWNIPANEIISGGVPKDGIPSLFNPVKIEASQADYLSDEDLVVGLVVGDQAIAYPHSILDWHEVVNEDISNKTFTMSYCPLTGTAIVFDGKNQERVLKFGVSGLLFRNNLIMFDRDTDSHWPQLRLQSDEGPLRDTKQIVLPSIETAWGIWKKLYPNTKILSTGTGFNRPYDRPGTAYPDYNLPNSPPLFRMQDIDRRLPPKQRVHGILIGDVPNNFKSKVYPINEDQGPRLINDIVNNQDVLVVDAGKENFVVSYYRIVNNTALFFETKDSTPSFPLTFKDKETNSTWNVMGEAIDGPLAGTRLERPLSFNAYWFAWAAFYGGTEIYDN